MPASDARRLEWALRALQAYIDSPAHIAEEDTRTAEFVRARVAHALNLIIERPGIGVLGAPHGEGRCPIAIGKRSRSNTC